MLIIDVDIVLICFGGTRTWVLEVKKHFLFPKKPTLLFNLSKQLVIIIKIREIIGLNRILKIPIFQGFFFILVQIFVLNFEGFWGSAEMRGLDFDKNKVFPSIRT